MASIFDELVAERGGATESPARPLEHVDVEIVDGDLVVGALDLRTPKLLTRGIRKRRSGPIVGYVGLNGQFKTAGMIRDTLPSLALGRKVLSTVTILDAFTGNAHPLFTPFYNWTQLVDRDGMTAVTNTDILLDEVTGIMDSRDRGMPKAVRKILPQQRRSGNFVRWTGIDWDNSDRRLRQLTWYAVQCRGYVPNNRLVRADGTADTLAMWKPNRLAYFQTHDAKTLNASTDSAQLTGDVAKKVRAKILNREFAWMSGSLTFKSYNTLDSVMSIDNACRVTGREILERKCDGKHEGPC